MNLISDKKINGSPLLTWLDWAKHRYTSPNDPAGRMRSVMNIARVEDASARSMALDIFERAERLEDLLERAKDDFATLLEVLKGVSEDLDKPGVK